MPTVLDRTATGRADATSDAKNKAEMSPDFNTSLKGALFAESGASHTQRLRGHNRTNYFKGRSPDRNGVRSGRGSSLSRGEEETDEMISRFKTITLHEDDEFYQAYINRGRISPLGFNE